MVAATGVAEEDYLWKRNPGDHSTPKRHPVQTANGRVVGHVEDGVLWKRVRGSRHMLRKPRAWAFDVQSLRDAEAAGATRVEVHDIDSGMTYSASLRQIRQCGFRVNRGHGDQIALRLGEWSVLSTHEQTMARQLELLAL